MDMVVDMVLLVEVVVQGKQEKKGLFVENFFFVLQEEVLEMQVVVVGGMVEWELSMVGMQVVVCLVMDILV